ncbi:MAG: hypothetical protein PHO45_05930 [Victivallaceae bacterium]|nr:hypothetical protein [Victivallaceae bacterium]
MNQHEINQAEWINPDNWSVGFYFSKKDNRTWVPKSIPWMGWTVNIGTRAGACWMLGFLIGLPLFILILICLTSGK